MKVYEAVTATLHELGVDRVFGVMGTANMRYLATYRDARNGSYVAATHEAGAVAMADGWSRLTGRPGVATVTHGPGVTNALTALTEAARAGSSLVVLTGSAAPDHSQWLDLRAAAALAGVGVHEVRGPQSVADDVVNAVRTSCVRRRPVIVDIPVRMLSSDAGPIAARCGFGPWPVARCEPDDDVLDAALGVIASARRPLVLVGRGTVLSGARSEVLGMAELLNAPLATTVMAKEFCADYPMHLGIFGTESHSLAIDAINQADCIIVLGAALNKDTTANGDLLRDKAVVRCDADPLVVSGGDPKWVSVLSDVKLFAAAVSDALEELGEVRESAWAHAIGESIKAFDSKAEFIDRSDARHVDIRSAMAMLDRILPFPRVLVTDTGRFKTAPWRHLSCTDGAFTQSGSFKAIGLGLAMAIGAAFACRDSTTVCVAGDGGVMMAIGELTVAVEHALPMVVAIADDAAYGSEYTQLEEYGHDPNYSRRQWPTFASVAVGFGAKGYVVRDCDRLNQLRAELADVSGPVVLDIKTNTEFNPRRYI